MMRRPYDRFSDPQYQADDVRGMEAVAALRLPKLDPTKPPPAPRPVKPEPTRVIYADDIGDDDEGHNFREFFHRPRQPWWWKRLSHRQPCEHAEHAHLEEDWIGYSDSHFLLWKCYECGAEWRTFLEG
jgi:hypothetical protein